MGNIWRETVFPQSWSLLAFKMQPIASSWLVTLAVTHTITLWTHMIQNSINNCFFQGNTGWGIKISNFSKRYKIWKKPSTKKLNIFLKSTLKTVFLMGFKNQIGHEAAVVGNTLLKTFPEALHNTPGWLRRNGVDFLLDPFLQILNRSRTMFENLFL